MRPDCDQSFVIAYRRESLKRDNHSEEGKSRGKEEQREKEREWSARLDDHHAYRDPRSANLFDIFRFGRKKNISLFGVSRLKGKITEEEREEGWEEGRGDCFPFRQINTEPLRWIFF